MLILKALKKLYSKLNQDNQTNTVECQRNPNIVAKKIYDLLNDDKACMIARFGAVELSCIANYLSIKSNNHSYLRYIQGKDSAWWWEDSIKKQLHNNAGFFPLDEELIERFCQLMIKDINEVNILGSWLKEENLFRHQIKSKNKVRLTLLDPYWSETPWTKALKGKKILIVHPFKNTIEHQYERRIHLFNNKDTLPEFKSLTVIKAVQSIAGNKTEFSNWFEALEYMKNEIDKIDYDICLISAGAYGFPLAAHVKRQGKKAIHMGGSLQLLFGIKGKRWEDPNYSNDFNYSALMNDYWIRPSEIDTPKKANTIENGCYW